MELEVINRKPESPCFSTPLLFVHGTGHAAWCWDEFFLPYFAGRGFDSYAVSLRWHGKSEGTENLKWTSVADYVADVFQIYIQHSLMDVKVENNFRPSSRSISFHHGSLFPFKEV